MLNVLTWSMLFSILRPKTYLAKKKKSETFISQFSDLKPTFAFAVPQSYTILRNLEKDNPIFRSLKSNLKTPDNFPQKLEKSQNKNTHSEMSEIFKLKSFQNDVIEIDRLVIYFIMNIGVQ